MELHGGGFSPPPTWPQRAAVATIIAPVAVAVVAALVVVRDEAVAAGIPREAHLRLLSVNGVAKMATRFCSATKGSTHPSPALRRRVHPQRQPPMVGTQIDTWILAIPIITPVS